MEEQQEVLIRCEQISKKYRGRTVLEDVSFEIRRGEFLSLLGPSGSGKTTILRLLIGIEQPTSGRILKEGKDILIAGHGAMNSSIVCQLRHLPLHDFWKAGIENCRLMRLV